MPRHAGATREAIARDKAIAKLGGIDVETMAEAERNSLLVDLCRLLGVSSVHAAADALKKVCAIASTVPALESFVKATRQVVQQETP